VRLSVNGCEHEVDVPPIMSLAHVLRETLGLFGTKIACNEGRCGACTVLVDGSAVLACLFPVGHADGADVTTIEGLGGERLTPLQDAMLEAGGVQCGACTPGMVMLLTAFLRDQPDPTPDAIREALAGNICRCTGYRSIVEAAVAAAGAA
jgi:carbon-monoxide dehydrogenase small subunit